MEGLQEVLRCQGVCADHIWWRDIGMIIVAPNGYFTNGNKIYIDLYAGSRLAK